LNAKLKEAQEIASEAKIKRTQELSNLISTANAEAVRERRKFGQRLKKFTHSSCHNRYKK